MLRRAVARWLGCAWLAAVTGACGSDEVARLAAPPVAVPPPRDFASGTRLHARYHRIEGVVDVLTTFHDAVLDTDCAYDDESGAHVGPNGTWYCYPAGLARHRDKRGPYLDPTCTVPGATIPAAGPATHVLVEPYDACTTAPEVHVALPPAVRGMYSRDDSGACTAEGFVRVQALGELLPPGAFVRATEQVEPRPGRIGARVLVGEDGSRHVLGGFDQSRGEASRPAVADDHVVRWLPARTAFVGAGDPLFADAACSAAAPSKIARTATCPLAAAIVLEGVCGGGSYFALGAPLTSVFRTGADGACTPGPTQGSLVFQLGAPIVAAAFEPVFTVDRGSARARRRGVAAFGDEPVAWTDVIDSTTGEPCEVVTTADGSLRCLPAASVIVAFFADAACTEPAFARPTGCDGPTAPRFVRDSFDAPVKAYEVVRRIDVLYENTGGGCRPFVPTTPSSSFAAREVDGARFPAAVLLGD